MSKASAYTERRVDGPLFEITDRTAAWVTRGGDLCIASAEDAARLTPVQVAAFTAWLIDTFGERVTA